MKLTVEKSIFLKELAEVAKYRNRDKDQGHYFMEANENGITFKVANANTYYVNVLPLQVIGEEDLETVHEVFQAGTVTVSSKFDEVIRKAPGNTVDIEVIDNVIKVSTTGFKASVPAVLESASSDIPHGDEVLMIDSPLSFFEDILTKAGFAYSTSESRPALTGIHLKGDGSVLTATTTDSHRLAQLKVASSITFDDVIVPAKPFIEVLSSFDSNEKVKLFKLPSHIKLVQDSKMFFIKLLDGTYPDVSKLVAIPESKQITIDSKELITAIDRALLFAKSSNDKHPCIRFEQTEEGLLRVSASNSDGAIDSEIAITKQTAPLTTLYGVNGLYLKAALKAYQAKEVTFHIVDNAQRPIFLKNEDSELVLLILPIKISA